MGIEENSVVTSGNMKMPVIGLGTWQASDEEIERALNIALDAGYRHFDTAFVYLNEAAIGKTLNKWFTSQRIKREELFIVTKLPPIGSRAEYVEMYIKESLESLQLDYVDLYLIHNPVGLKHDKNNLFARDEKGELALDFETDHISLWKAMERQVDAGRAKAIGVSNFNVRQVKRIIENCRIRPATNQIEMHIYLQQKEMLAFCHENNVVITAYAPLGSPGLIQFTESLGVSTDGIPKLTPLTEPVVVDIAKKHNKLPGQVLLRFLLQLGVAVIPKSTNSERIKQNFHIFDFDLSEGEMSTLKSLDKGKAGRMFTEGIFKGAEVHPEYPYN